MDRVENSCVPEEDEPDEMRAGVFRFTRWLEVE